MHGSPPDSFILQINEMSCIPIINDKPRNLVKIPGVACHQNAVYRQYNCGNSQILGAYPHFFRPEPLNKYLILNKLPVYFDFKLCICRSEDIS